MLLAAEKPFSTFSQTNYKLAQVKAGEAAIRTLSPALHFGHPQLALSALDTMVRPPWLSLPSAAPPF